MEIREIIMEMNHNIDSILRHLLPNGKRVGREYRVGSLAGEEGQSLGVHLSGSKIGLWSDFAADGSGDLLELWKSVNNQNTVEALKDIKMFLNIQDEDRNLYQPKVKEYKRPAKIEDKPTDKVRAYLNKRGITDEQIEKFKIAFKDSKIIFPYYRDGVLINNKYLGYNKNGKKELKTEKEAEPCLFGWHTIDDNAREIVICEGEIDAISMNSYGYNSLSVPYGAGVNGANKWIENDWHLLDRFDTIYICMDMDEPGQKAAQDIVTRLGLHRCKIVSLPLNDVNDCHTNNLDLTEYIKSAKYVQPSNLKDISEFKNDILYEFEPRDNQEYFSPQFHDKWRNVEFNKGELTVWGGINGHGKTTFLMQVALDAVSQDKKFCIASLEQKPEKYLRKIIKQSVLEQNPDPSLIKNVIEWLSGKIWIYNRVGISDNKDMIKTFEYAHKRYGVDNFIIDSLSKCGFAEDDYNGQKLFIERLTDVCLLNNIHIHLVVHSRKKLNERHEMNKMDIKGTGAISDLAFNVILIFRNKEKERAIESNDRSKDGQADATVVVEKQREKGWEGLISFMFNRNYEIFYQEEKGYVKYFQ